MSQLVLTQLISTKTNRGLPNGMVVFGLATSHDSEIVSKRVRVRPGDQPGYPKDTIESFVGHSSMGLLCPPAVENKSCCAKTGNQNSQISNRLEVLHLFRCSTHTH